MTISHWTAAQLADLATLLNGVGDRQAKPDWIQRRGEPPVEPRDVHDERLRVMDGRVKRCRMRMALGLKQAYLSGGILRVLLPRRLFSGHVCIRDSHLAAYATCVSSKKERTTSGRFWVDATYARV